MQEITWNITINFGKKNNSSLLYLHLIYGISFFRTDEINKKLKSSPS